MRKLTAKILRRVAARLHPLAQSEPVTPLEFIPTVDLAEEIRRRNDAAVVYWGRHDSGSRRDGASFMYRLSFPEAKRFADSSTAILQQRFAKELAAEEAADADDEDYGGDANASAN